MSLLSTDPASSVEVKELAGAYEVGEYLSYDTFFEHGQWWVRYEFDDEDEPCRTFSVVDASPGVAYGLDLEEI